MIVGYDSVLDGWIFWASDVLRRQFGSAVCLVCWGTNSDVCVTVSFAADRFLENREGFKFKEGAGEWGIF